ISGRSVNISPEHAQPRALQAVLLQKLRIVLRNLAFGKFGDRVRGVIPGDHFQHSHRVFYSARHRAADVVAQVEWDDPIAARQPHAASPPPRSAECRPAIWKSPGL